MHSFVTINNYQSDLILEANATQYKVITNASNYMYLVLIRHI